MKPSFKVATASSLIALASLATTSVHATETYITNFEKTDNIYTNLNEQFPATSSTGVPGSGVGAANASFIYNPYAYQQSHGIPNSDLVGDNGISFDLTSNSTGQDFAEVVDYPSIVTDIAGVTTVYALMAAFDGTSFNVTFAGSGGTTQTFNNIGLPDFNGGGPVNDCGSTVCVQTVYQVHDVGAGGSGNSTTGAYNYYDLTEVAFQLPASFDDQSLVSTTFTSNGYQTLLLGLTAVSAVSAVPEPDSLALCGLGLGLIGFLARRRRG